jgi:hypothetical protein
MSNPPSLGQAGNGEEGDRFRAPWFQNRGRELLRNSSSKHRPRCNAVLLSSPDLRRIGETVEPWNGSSGPSGALLGHVEVYSSSIRGSTHCAGTDVS